MPRVVLRRIVSGGQTGVDEAALATAARCGVETGGWMPRSFLTARGPRPEFRDRYGMREHPKSSFPPRTEANVRDSDATLIPAFGLAGDGIHCTTNAVKRLGRPKYAMDLSPPTPIAVRATASWIRVGGWQVLTVPGNREAEDGSIFRAASTFLAAVFGELGFRPKED